MVSLRGARLYRSDALLANALHFGSDFAGTLAVLAGLIAAALGLPGRRLDRGALRLRARRGRRRRGSQPQRGRAHGPSSEDDARSRGRRSRDSTARRAPAAPSARAGGQHFADVVIGVAPEPRSARATPLRTRWSRRYSGALPGIDVVVHVEPLESAGASASARSRPRSPCRACARSTTSGPRRGRQHRSRAPPEVSRRLPARPSARHRGAGGSSDPRGGPGGEERADPSRAAAETAAGEEIDIDTAAIEQAVREETGAEPRELRFVRTDDGIVVFLTLGLGGAGSLAEAHGRASADRGARAQCRSGDRRRRGTHRAVRLCMFHPVGHPLERGWVGRVDGDRVVQLAAQTLQSFFTGGGDARQHAEYPLARSAARTGPPPAVRPRLRRPVDVRIRESGGYRGARCYRGRSGRSLTVSPRIAGVIGAEGLLPIHDPRRVARPSCPHRRIATSLSGSVPSS